MSSMCLVKIINRYISKHTLHNFHLGCHGILFHAQTMGFSERILIGRKYPSDTHQVTSSNTRDACMTWTLDNGTIVMQNFVNKDQVNVMK